MIIWEKRNLPEDAFLVSLGVAALYTNIPQEKINTVCKAYQTFYGENTPIPTQSLRGILKLIIQENSFEFSSKNYLQTYEMRWVQRWQLPLPTSFCRRSRQKYRTSAKLNLLSGKDRLTIFFSLWRTERKEIDEFIALANRQHPSIKFTAKNIW